jgi:vacuolar-type H+-ATPase subunit E/Vma4
MSGKENIIANILAEAEAESAETLRIANEKAAEIEKADQTFCDKAKAEATARAEQEGKQTMARYISVAGMDVKKVLLQAKQDKMTEAMERAEKAILSLPEEKYNTFLIGMIEKYAEKGDVVVFAASDKKKVKAAAQYAESKGFTSRADGDFSGGLILESGNCDKNLTLSILLKEYKEGHESEIAAILAGE